MCIHHDVHAIFNKVLLFQVVVVSTTSWWTVEGSIWSAVIVPVFWAGSQGYLWRLGGLVMYSCGNESVVSLGAGFLFQVDIF